MTALPRPSIDSHLALRLNLGHVAFGARAAIMGTVYLAALLVGRPRSIVPALGFVAALMVAVDPKVLWSISFQLSFVAMAGIAVLAEPVSERIQGL